MDPISAWDCGVGGLRREIQIHLCWPATSQPANHLHFKKEKMEQYPSNLDSILKCGDDSSANKSDGSDLISHSFFADSAIHYTAHHNWAWVLAEAIQLISIDKARGQRISTCLCGRFKELPSQKCPDKLAKKTKIKYALFRVEVCKNLALASSVHRNVVAESVSAWATSLAFAFLDPKDALYRELNLQGAGHLMPKTTLLDWDVCNVDDVGELPSSPALLKAALGSGGFGLYFVNDRNDVLSIIKAHAKRAQTFSGFLDSLKNDHGGNVPCWSLQSLVNSHRIVCESNYTHLNSEDLTESDRSELDVNCPQMSITKNSSEHLNLNSPTKRCQIRVYAVCRGSHLYMYDMYEARMPSWDVDLDEELNATSAAAAVNVAQVAAASKELDQLNIAPESETLTESVSTVAVITTTTPTATNVNARTRASPQTDLLPPEGASISTSNEQCEIGSLEDDNLLGIKAAEKTLTVEEFEVHCCAGSNARPYNKERNKSVTERFIFDELDGIVFAKKVVGDCVRNAMKALRGPILHQINSFTDSDLDSGNRSEVAIAGIDLMLELNEDSASINNPTEPCTPKLRAYILEINNNPAMVGENKKMSPRYKEHIVLFVKNLLLLGLVGSNAEQLGFELIW